MSSPLISNQSVTVQLPATDRVVKLKELLAEALKLQLDDYEVYHNGQKLNMDYSFQYHGIGGEELVVLKVDITSAHVKRLEIGEFSVVIDTATEGGNLGTVDGCTQTGNFSEESERTELGGQQQQKIDDILSSRNLFPQFQPQGGQAFQSLAPVLLIQNFLKVCEAEMQISRDPRNWTAQEVCQFINWLVEELNIKGVEASQFRMNGVELCNLSKQDLTSHFPSNLVDVLWMYLETLKFATGHSIINPSQQLQSQAESEVTGRTIGVSNATVELSPLDPITTQTVLTGDTKTRTSSVQTHTIASSMSRQNSNSGQIQLWQFLLELLTDRASQSLITWVGDKGAFKLLDPEKVAQLWGERKNKPAMNYEKLSRALRYYYDGDMIHKVHGKRFVYKFVCDLKMLLGYSAAELSKFVNETPIPITRDDQDCYVAISMNSVLSNVESFTS